MRAKTDSKTYPATDDTEIEGQTMLERTPDMQCRFITTGAVDSGAVPD